MTNNMGGAHGASRSEDMRPNVASLNARRGQNESPFLRMLRLKNASFLRAEKPERPTFGVAGLIPHGLATLWATEPGFAKSTEIRRLAAKVAWWMPGTKWLNTEVAEPKNNRVLVICGEDPAMIADTSFHDVDSVRMMDEWQAAHPDRKAEDNLVVVYEHEVSPLFSTKGGKVFRTKDGDDLFTFIQDWQPDLIVIDTLTSLSEIDFELNVGQATALINGIGKLVPPHSMCVVPHHFVKVSDTKNLREGLHQTRGSGGFQSRARHIMVGYEAYPPLEDLVRENGWGGCDETSKIVVVGTPKTNVPGAALNVPRIYVRQPMIGTIMQEMVEITEDVLADPIGARALAGKLSVSRSSTRGDTKSSNGQRGAK